MISMSANIAGAKSLGLKLRGLEAEADAIMAQGAFEAVEATMEEIATVPWVPVDTGELRASGYVAPPERRAGAVRVTAGFSAPYAARVHENPRAGRTGGLSPTGKRYRTWAKVGQWKFLEEPMRRNASKHVAIVARKLNQWLARRARTTGTVARFPTGVGSRFRGRRGARR